MLPSTRTQICNTRMPKIYHWANSKMRLFRYGRSIYIDSKSTLCKLGVTSEGSNKRGGGRVTIIWRLLYPTHPPPSVPAGFYTSACTRDEFYSGDLCTHILVIACTLPMIHSRLLTHISINRNMYKSASVLTKYSYIGAKQK